MAYNNDLPFSEQSWRNDADYRERYDKEREECEMEEWEIADARAEAAQLAQWPITCDGSGIIEEIYFDVDQTEVIKCKGCPACDLELVEFVGRKPVSSEKVSNSRKEVA